MKQQSKEPPEKIWYFITTILFIAIIGGVIWGISALFSGNSKPTTKAVTHTAAVKPPTHKVVYMFSVTKSTLSAADQQDVGIGWHNPSNNAPSGPTNVTSAIAQIASGGYSVSFDVAKVNNDNLEAGVNNYTDPDASVSCTITVDGKVISTEQAPAGGGSQCAGTPADSQSFAN